MISLVLFDFDGTFTDGKVYFGENEEITKAYNVIDGYGIKLLHENGLKVGIITGYKETNSFKSICQHLKIDFYYEGVSNKIQKLDEIKNKLGITYDQIAYFGDDINDLEIMDKLSLNGCVNNSSVVLKKTCNFISEKNGGQGAVREFCDYIIEINNTRNKKLLCFIPVRYNSSRLPGKPLLKFGNKSMIQLLYEKIKEVDEIDKIILLTDNVKIKEHVELFGAECHIIDEDCNSGTERIAHYLNKFQNSYKYILNVQGDEPFINIENVRSCIKDYENLNHNSDIKCFCLHSTCDSDHEISNKKFVKLILNKKNNVVYMSRQNVPTEFINLGSAFILEKKFLLEEFLNSHSPLQINEDIEWNNILDSGYKIHSTFVATHERSVDTQEDYDYLLKKYNYAN